MKVLFDTSVLVSAFIVNHPQHSVNELLMSQFIQPINLQISPDSLNRGEEAIRQELALHLYAQNIFTFSQARHLANLSVWEF